MCKKQKTNPPEYKNCHYKSIKKGQEGMDKRLSRHFKIVTFLVYRTLSNAVLACEKVYNISYQRNEN